jgi:hypothetical protein
LQALAVRFFQPVFWREPDPLLPTSLLIKVHK